MSEKQHTLAKELFMNGQGLHTGDPVSVRVLPAPVNAGIVFIRADLPHRPTISVKTKQVASISPRRKVLCLD